MSQRILIVEDQEDNRRILRDLLTAPGSNWWRQPPARRACGWPRSIAPISFSWTCRCRCSTATKPRGGSRHSRELRGIPIIVITSYALSGDDAKAKAAGADAYVAKPFSPRALLATIRQFLP